MEGRVVDVFVPFLSFNHNEKDEEDRF